MKQKLLERQKEIDELKLKRAELKRKEARLKGLPHLYRFKWYPWSHKVFHAGYKECNGMLLVTAANQISKSSTMIRKCIEMSGNPNIWPMFWQTRPRQFWYLYPDKKVATSEFQMKWETEFMPCGEFKDHPTYGWTVHYDAAKKIDYVQFNSGVRLTFHGYLQGLGVSTLQSTTLHAAFLDEECPEKVLAELQARLIATRGLFMSVFTATLGQEVWFKAMERIGQPDENFKKAMKIQVSMYDCKKYVDGTDSFWNDEYIDNIKSKCNTENEILRRVYGRFIKSDGMAFPSFVRSERMLPYVAFKLMYKVPEKKLLPPGWHIVTSTDRGPGGEKGHPSATTLLAVRPDFKYGVVFRFWRSEGEVTSDADCGKKREEMVANLPTPFINTYDGAALDYYNYMTKIGVPMVPANKKRTEGHDLVNNLFRSNMIHFIVNDDDPLCQTEKLANELSTLKKDENKRTAKDDGADSYRYAVMAVPWVFPEPDKIGKAILPVHMAKEKVPTETERRRNEMKLPCEIAKENYSEISYINDLCGEYDGADI